MKNKFLKVCVLTVVFISSLYLFAEVVCEESEPGDQGTEAGNIKANCNVNNNDNTVSVSSRDVNVDKIAKVLEAGSLVAPPPKSSSSSSGTDIGTQ